MALGKSQRVIKNSLYNNVGYFSQLFISLLLIPFIIHKLGVEIFGIWVLLEVIVSYLSLLDFTGIGGAFVKYIAEYNARKDYESVNEVVNLGWLYYTFFWMSLLVLVLFFRKPLLSLFRIPQELFSLVSFVFVGVLLISFIRSSFSVFRSVLLGLQRMDLTNIIAVSASLVNAAGVVIFLSLGLGLKGLVASGLIAAVLTGFLQTLLSRRVFPRLRFRPFSWSKTIFKKTLAYGIHVRVASIAELINMHVDKIFLGYFLNTGLVGLYELGAKIARIARSFPEQLLPAILPASSELHALDDRVSLRKLYHRGSKYLSLLTLPVALFMVGHAHPIMTLWMGKSGFRDSALALQILSIGYVFVLLVSMARLVARGMGIPQYEMRSSVLIAVLNVVLSAVLIIRMGFIGALLGTAIAGTAGSLFFILSFNRRIGESTAHFFKKIFAAPLFFSGLALIVSFTAGAVLEALFLHAPASNRLEALLFLLVAGIVFMPVYLFLLLKTGYIDSYDREVLSGFFELMRRGLRRTK